MTSASFINAVVSCFCFLASAIAAVISFLLFLNRSASAWSRRHSVSSFNRSSTWSSLSGRPLLRTLSLTISGFSLTTLMSSKTGSRSRFSPSVKKPMSSLVVPRLFKGQPLSQTSVLELHQHDVVYFGVVNLIDNGYVMGAIDVWKCRSCPQTFCEDKRFGMTDLAPEVGLPKIEPGSKWAALICTRNNGSNRPLIQARPGTPFQHPCTPDTKPDLKVGPDYFIEAGPASGIGQHRIILVENFVNAPVDVITGKKHLGTTNANQALGKPFSFTPPLSAAVIQPSKYNTLNLTSILFIVSGVWLGLLASFSPGNPAVLGVLAILALATVVSGIFLRKPKLWPATLGLVAVAAAFAAQLWIQYATGLTASATTLDVLLAASIVTGWLSWSRVRNLRARQWHPLDMPAYG